MKRSLLALVSLAATAPLLPGAAASPARNATVLIRHEAKGCHSMSVNYGAYRATQVVRIAPGGVLTVINNDVEVQQFVQLSGPKARVKDGVMDRPGASARMTFPRRGTYRFRNEEGKPFVPDFEAEGENVLRLIVVVR